MKFRKKPVVVDAIKYTYHNLDEIIAFGGGTIVYAKPQDKPYVHTLEGIMAVDVNDWIIKGIKRVNSTHVSRIYSKLLMRLLNDRIPNHPRSLPPRPGLQDAD